MPPLENSNPLSRLEFCKSEIDRIYGRDFSHAHPELTAAVMLSAALDFHGLQLAKALRDVSAALLIDDGFPSADALRSPAILR